MKTSFKRQYVKYRTYSSTALLVISLLILFFDKEAKNFALVTVILAGINIFFNSIPEVTYTKAGRIAQKKSTEAMKSALETYERAMFWGLKPQQEIVVGTLQLQYGDKERGKEILESYLEDTNRKLVDAVKVSLSMYYWMNKDLEKAIALCEEAYNDGFKETNLYINLCTYYLEADRTKDYQKCYKEAFDNKMGSVVMKDLEASLALKEGKYQRAGNCLKEIFDKVNPAFEDPYVHFAVVNLHYGNWEGAVDYLERIDMNCQYNNTSIFTKEEIQTLMAAIKDEETRWSVLEAAHQDPSLFILGTMPEIRKGVMKPECPPLPNFMEETSPSVPVGNNTEERDDEREVSTDLTDDDEEWIRKHS